MSTQKTGTTQTIRKTHEIDATGQVVGRLSARIARLLMGKHKVTYTPHIDAGDFVHVVNISNIVFTGRKWEQKKHFRSSNRPGGIKAIPMSRLRKENPGEILRHAVLYMLPKNRTQSTRMKRLKIA